MGKRLLNLTAILFSVLGNDLFTFFVPNSLFFFYGGGRKVDRLNYEIKGYFRTLYLRYQHKYMLCVPSILNCKHNPA